MKKNDYSQARERIEFATAIVELAIAILTLAGVAHSLLSVAFNYPRQSKQ